MRWIGDIGPRWTLAIIVAIAVVIAPIVWLVKHPCMRYGPPHTCESMWCTAYDSNGFCIAWMPYEYECRDCLVRR